MSARFPGAGKVPAAFLQEWVYPRCGARRPEVRVGPGPGIDTAVIDLPGGHALAMTTDPCSLVPTLGLRESAWLTVHLLASDLATTGCAPQYALFDLALPPDLSEDHFRGWWGHVHEFCEALGCAIVGGHTARFEGQHASVVGGGMMATVAPREQMLTSADARPGDTLILTGECGLAAVAILALSFPRTIGRACGDSVLEAGRQRFYRTSTVAAALAAVSAGRGEAGVRAMHDATEGGVRAALVELAEASGCGLRIDAPRLPISETARAIASVFSLDPFGIVGAGALVIAASPAGAGAVLDALHAAAIPATVVGELTHRDAGLRLVDAEGGTQALTHPGEDPYWQAFSHALARGWQ